MPDRFPSLLPESGFRSRVRKQPFVTARRALPRHLIVLPVRAGAADRRLSTMFFFLLLTAKWVVLAAP
jgi:hypothetical protein